MYSTNRVQMACWATVSLVLMLFATPAVAVDEQMAKAIEQAKTDYQPVSDEELQAAQTELATAGEELETLLIPGSDRGERWKKYLKWEGVQNSLANADKPDLAALSTTLGKLSSGADGTELPQFRRVRLAISKYLDLAQIGRISDQNKAINRQLDLLTTYLDRYATEPSPRTRFEIERRLGFFSGIERSEGLTDLVFDQFDEPNLKVEVSEHLLNTLIGEPVDDEAPVTDCILGTSIRGTGWTTGTISLETVPNDNRATIQIRVDGITRSRTLGFNDPVVIRSTGTTPFVATKKLEFEDTNFWNYPTQVSATTSTVTQSVEKQGGGFGSRIIAAIGEQKVNENKPRANFIAARHAEERIANNLNDELLPKIQDARYEYLYSFKQPLADRDAEPKLVHFSSTDHSIQVDLLQSSGGQLGADSLPAELPEAVDVSIDLHETGVANMLATYLSGAKLSQKTKDADPKLDVTLPEFVTKAMDKAREEADTEPAEDDNREFKPWSIVFRRDRPVSVEFADNQVKLTLHATTIAAGDDTYEGWDIIVAYELSIQEGELTLVRTGEIDVLPTSFDPADGKGLSSRIVGLRGNLAKELNRQADAGRGFPKEINIPSLKLPERFEDHGPLVIEQAKSQGGWLSLGWNLP